MLGDTDGMKKVLGKDSSKFADSFGGKSINDFEVDVWDKTGENKLRSDKIKVQKVTG